MFKTGKIKIHSSGVPDSVKMQSHSAAQAVAQKRKKIAIKQDLR
jgi:hypothetical protein